VNNAPTGFKNNEISLDSVGGFIYFLLLVSFVLRAGHGSQCCGCAGASSNHPDGMLQVFMRPVFVFNSERRTIMNLSFFPASRFRTMQNSEFLSLWAFVTFMFFTFVHAQGDTPSLSLTSLAPEDSSIIVKDEAVKPLSPNSIIRVVLRNNAEYIGRILFLNESLLLFWKSVEPYDESKTDEFAMVVPSREIQRIIVQRKTHIKSGLGYGFLAGAGAGAIMGFASGDDEEGFFQTTAGQKALIGGIFFGAAGASIGGIISAVAGIDDDYDIAGNEETYRSVVPALVKNALFSTMLPPGLQALLSQKTIQPVASSGVTAGQTDKLPGEESSPRLHLSLGVTAVFTPAHDDIVDAFISSGFGGASTGWFGTTYYPIDKSNSMSWNAEVDYTIARNVRLGLGHSKIAHQLINGRDMETESADRTSYSLLLEYIPVPVRPVLISRLEFALGAGVDYHVSSVDGTLSTLIGSAYGKQAVSFSLDKTSVGAHVMASADYYLSKSFSFQFKMDKTFVPAIHVPEINYANPSGDGVKILHDHSVNISSFDLAVSLRLHL
jgi:hypothetical protein